MVFLDPASAFGRNLHLPERGQAFSDDQCFLCGIVLTRETRTDEHVIPRWLQRRHDLWNQQISLTNETMMRYTQLTIPCCFSCNNVHLGPLETEVRDAADEGIAGVQAMAHDRLFLWLAKLAYGLFYRELFLSMDRRTPEAGGMLTPEALAGLAVHHALLQAVRGVVTYDQPPCTILLYETQTGDDPRQNFDYNDNFHGPFLAVRTGSVGLIAVLQDWGILQLVRPNKLFGEAYAVGPLAPLQFRELMAYGLYVAASLLPKRKLFVHPDGDKTRFVPTPLATGTPLIAPFNADQYARVLARALDVSVERLVAEKGQWRTFLHDENGNPTPLPFDAWFE